MAVPEVMTTQVEPLHYAIDKIVSADTGLAAYHCISREEVLGLSIPPSKWLVVDDKALFMIYRNKRILPLGDPESIARALRNDQFRAEIADRFTYVTRMDEGYTLGVDWYNVLNSRPVDRMVLSAGDFIPTIYSQDSMEIVPLLPEHKPDIERVLTDYPNNAFRDHRLKSGLYRGLVIDGELASLAGIHGVSLTNKVAVIGDVVTKKGMRGKGYGPICISAVADELFKLGINLIAVNIFSDNSASISSHRKVGFRQHCQLLEIDCEKRSPRKPNQ